MTGVLYGVKMIEGDDTIREQKCLLDLQRVLEQYDCNMVPEVVITGGQIMTRVAIIAKKRVMPADGKRN